jgi:hypothetical protein
LNNKGGQIKLLNLTQRLQEVMTITKLVTIFDVYEDESKAVDSFKMHFANALPTAPGMTSAPLSSR